MAQHVKHAREIVICGYQVRAVPCTAGELISEIAGELAIGKEFGACYFDTPEGDRVFSLRSRGDFDVSEVAKRMGGGGHKKAAGFKIRIPDLNILTNVARPRAVNE